MRPSDNSAVREVDALFLGILQHINKSIVDASATAVAEVLKLSEGYLSEKAQKALVQFHDLYFNASDDAGSTQAVNADVDRLIEDLRADMKSGKDVSTIADRVQENEDVKNARLRLSAIQKELETMIRLDAGIREKLLPVLSSMQFEDMTRQRLQHLDWAWASIINGFDQHGLLDIEMLCVEIEANLSSVAERNLFYRTVLKKDPPTDSGLEDGNIWLSFE
jgi:hypothetical protein